MYHNYYLLMYDVSAHNNRSTRVMQSFPTKKHEYYTNSGRTVFRAARYNNIAYNLAYAFEKRLKILNLHSLRSQEHADMSIQI